MSKVDSDTKRVERQIYGWLPQLDAAFKTQEQAVVVGMSLRAAQLFRGVIHACTGPSLASAEVILRTLVDLAVQMRWIEERPGVRVQLWLAEYDRGRLVLARGWEGMHRRRGHETEPAFTPAERAKIEKGVRVTRETAIAAGEPVRPKGSLLPTAERMAQAIPDLFEAYNVAFRGLSPTTHTGGLSFAADSFERREDGMHVKPGAPYSPSQIRALSASAMLFVIASASRQLGLGIAHEADALRVEFTRWHHDAPTRADAR